MKFAATNLTISMQGENNKIAERSNATITSPKFPHKDANKTLPNERKKLFQENLTKSLFTLIFTQETLANYAQDSFLRK
jgi:hypothetical protein